MRDGSIYYTATTGTNKVVTAKPALLQRIIIGTDVGSSVVEVSDHASDGNGNVKIYLADSNLGTKYGVIEVNAVFQNGICMDLTNQTYVTVVYTNLGA